MEDALRGISGTRPDVILTDIGLPGMDGVEGTRILRDHLAPRGFQVEHHDVTLYGRCSDCGKREARAIP